VRLPRGVVRPPEVRYRLDFFHTAAPRFLVRFLELAALSDYPALGTFAEEVPPFFHTYLKFQFAAFPQSSVISALIRSFSPPIFHRLLDKMN